MALPASDSPAAIRCAALTFRNEMRIIIEEIRSPGRVSPEVLAERFCEGELSAAERRWSSHAAREHYRAEVGAQVQADIGLRATPDPLYERFLARLLEKLNEAR